MMKECKASMGKEGRKEMRGTGRKRWKSDRWKKKKGKLKCRKGKSGYCQNKVDESEEGTTITNENR